MRTLRLVMVAAVVAVSLYAATTVLAQPFDETTISFSFADDDILKDPGETRKNSPAAYIGGQAENGVDRVGGSVFNKTSTRLSLHKRVDTGNLYPEGNLRLRMAVDDDGEYTFHDDSTYLSLNWTPIEDHKVHLTMYPVDSDRLRLGYHYDISWGGTRVFPTNFTRGLVPAFVVGAETPRLGGFIGLKTALVRSPAEDILDNPGGNTNQFVERTFYGLLGGAHVRLTEGLKIHLSGGYFGKGTSTRADVLGAPIHSGGFSTMISYHTGGEVGKRLDLRMYYEDPDNYALAPKPDAYNQDFGFDVALEYSRLTQTLEDPDRFGSTTNENSNALALSAGLRLQKLRIHFDAIYRDLSYIVWNVPGFVPNQALPKSADLAHGGSFAFLPEFLGGEIFAVLSTDYFVEFTKSMGFTPAISIGFLLPATYTPTASESVGQGPFSADHAKGIQTTVVRGSNANDWDTLPPGDEELPVFMAKLDLRYNLSQHFSIVGEISYANDPNYSQVELDQHGHAKRVFIDPHIIGLGVVSELAF
jgi:hypothetical protein